MPLPARIAALAPLILLATAAHADNPLSAVANQARGGPPRVAAPVHGHPVRLLTALGGGVSALMSDGTVRAIPSGEVVLDVRAEGEERTTTQRVICAAGAGPRVACLRAVVHADERGADFRKELQLVDSDEGRRVIASGAGQGYDLAPLGIHVGTDGQVRLAYAETTSRSDQTVTRQLFLAGSDRAEMRLDFGGTEANKTPIGVGERADPPLQMLEFQGRLWLVYRAGEAIVAHPPGEPKVLVAASSRHDIRPLVGPDGWFYIFYHEPRSATARAAASQDGRVWRDLTLDGEQSGWQLDAAAGGDAVHGVFYFFRNSLHKGLRAAALRDGEQVGRAMTVFREDRFNAGWHPHLAIAADGTTWLTWLSNVDERERAWSRFATPDALRDDTAGPEAPAERPKDYFLLTGAGGWLTSWHPASLVPTREDTAGIELGSPSYNVGLAMLLTANVEARWRALHLGLSYAQGIVDDAAASVEDTSGVLRGAVRIEELLPGHDVKVAAVWGRYRGKVRAGTAMEDPLAELPLETNSVDTQISALNRWRIQYGFAFTHYSIPAAVHAWASPAGSSAYAFAGSHLRDVSISELALVLGYSKLDHAAGYRDHYSGLVFDGAAGAGLALFGFDPIPTDQGEVQDGLGLHLRATAQLGWLYFHRWQPLRGFGVYVRPAYAAELRLSGLPSGPPPRSQTEGTATTTAVSLLWVRHGPWLDAGAIW
jgi:hypothetical protein